MFIQACIGTDEGNHVPDFFQRNRRHTMGLPRGSLTILKYIPTAAPGPSISLIDLPLWQFQNFET